MRVMIFGGLVYTKGKNTRLGNKKPTSLEAGLDSMKGLSFELTSGCGGGEVLHS